MLRSCLISGVVLMAALRVGASAAPLESVLYSFKGGTDGGLPLAGLLGDSAGNLYGTLTQGGGTAGGSTACSVAGCGAVFELKPPAKPRRPWTKKLLYSFHGAPTDGADPQGGLIADALGNFYGTTVDGGAGFGIAFELVKPAPGKTAWREKVLHAFKGGTDGSLPDGTLLLDARGDLYGTTSEGGGGGAAACVVGRPVYCGTVFRLSPPAPGRTAWKETILYSFVGGANDAAVPRAGLIRDAHGTLYGTTQYGGPFDFGTVFSLAPPLQHGGAWRESVLLFFPAGEGVGPQSTLLMDAAGDLYGTSNESVFGLAPGGPTGWTYSVLHHFLGPDGAFPGYAGLISDGSDNLYSTTSAGGVNSNNGTVFEMTPPVGGQGSWTETVLHTFAGNPTDGQAPYAPVIMDTTGALYGTTLNGGTDNFGAVFKTVP